MKLGIVGGGTVGQATARTYLEWVEEVRVFDLLATRRAHALAAVLAADLVFICLPENSIAEFFQACAEDETLPPFVIRSTVPIGFTRTMAGQYLLDVVHSPEFLTERCSFTDAQMPNRNILGVATEGKACLHLKTLWFHRFPTVPILTMTSDESEAVKLFLNAFFGVKVAFFNEVHQLAMALELDWETVLGGILGDGRIAHSHTTVPGPDGSFGFGGKCLPKDMETLASTMGSQGQCPHIIRAALERNKEDRRRWKKIA